MADNAQETSQVLGLDEEPPVNTKTPKQSNGIIQFVASDYEVTFTLTRQCASLSPFLSNFDGRLMPMERIYLALWETPVIIAMSIPKDIMQLIAEYAETLFVVRQVTSDTMTHVCTYLRRLNGRIPDPLPCPVRSTNMKQIAPELWMAEFIDAFEKKTVFEIILAANYLDIKPLLHLGCAKIATEIKKLDQSEINRIIEEEERYQAAAQLTRQVSQEMEENENENGNRNESESEETPVSSEENKGIMGLDESDDN